MAVNRLSIIKFIELALTVTCIGLHYHTETGNFETDFISAAAFGGYLVIVIGGLAGHLTSSPITKRIDIFFCLVGCAAFLAAGSLNIKHFNNRWQGKTRDSGTTKALLAIINGVIFLIDCFLTWVADY